MYRTDSELLAPLDCTVATYTPGCGFHNFGQQHRNDDGACRWRFLYDDTRGSPQSDHAVVSRATGTCSEARSGSQSNYGQPFGQQIVCW